jgi:hypothetical protein
MRRSFLSLLVLVMALPVVASAQPPFPVVSQSYPAEVCAVPTFPLVVPAGSQNSRVHTADARQTIRLKRVGSGTEFVVTPPSTTIKLITETFADLNICSESLFDAGQQGSSLTLGGMSGVCEAESTQFHAVTGLRVSKFYQTQSVSYSQPADVTISIRPKFLQMFGVQRIDVVFGPPIQFSGQRTFATPFRGRFLR